MVTKVLKKLVNNRIANYLQKCDLFTDSHNDFRSAWSTADLLTVVSDRMARALNMSYTTRGVALDTCKAFGRV